MDIFETRAIRGSTCGFPSEAMSGLVSEPLLAVVVPALPGSTVQALRGAKAA